LHKGLLGVNAREILNRNHHDSKIVKNMLPWAKKGGACSVTGMTDFGKNSVF
jgi:hypothetical protein